MKFRNHFTKVTLLVFAIAMMSFALNYAHANKASNYASVNKAAPVEYSFKVHNKARCYIDELLVSENGKSWGDFDLGNGIAPGQTMPLVWSRSTDNSNCEWWIKAKYADGTMSKAGKFDFCEENLVLEF